MILLGKKNGFKVREPESSSAWPQRHTMRKLTTTMTHSVTSEQRFLGVPMTNPDNDSTRKQVEYSHCKLQLVHTRLGRRSSLVWPTHRVTSPFGCRQCLSHMLTCECGVKCKCTSIPNPLKMHKSMLLDFLEGCGLNNFTLVFAH